MPTKSFEEDSVNHEPTMFIRLWVKYSDSDVLNKAVDTLLNHIELQKAEVEQQIRRMDKPKYKQQLGIFLVNMYVASREDKWLACSGDPNHYSGEVLLSYRIFVDGILNNLAPNFLIFRQGKNIGIKLYNSYKPTPALLEIFSDWSIHNVDWNLKTKRGKKVSYINGSKSKAKNSSVISVDEIPKTLSEISGQYDPIRITLPKTRVGGLLAMQGKSLSKTEWSLHGIKESEYIKQAAERVRKYAKAQTHSKVELRGEPIFITPLYRSFNEDFVFGGRFNGYKINNMKGRDRADLTINGEPVIEVDYSCLHIRMMWSKFGGFCGEGNIANREEYANCPVHNPIDVETGLPHVDTDLYNMINDMCIEGLPEDPLFRRALKKKLVMIGLNCKTLHGAALATLKSLKSSNWEIESGSTISLNALKLLATAACKAHPPLALRWGVNVNKVIKYKSFEEYVSATYTTEEIQFIEDAGRFAKAKKFYEEMEEKRSLQPDEREWEEQALSRKNANIVDPDEGVALQYKESILMDELMDIFIIKMSIIIFGVHDSIIIPKRYYALACYWMKRVYLEQWNTYPGLKPEFKSGEACNESNDFKELANKVRDEYNMASKWNDLAQEKDDTEWKRVFDCSGQTLP